MIKKIVLESNPYVKDDTPFKGDVLARGAFADSLTSYIKALSVGAVIAIDGEWGEGKSWFGRNWEAALKKNGFRTVYYDAFSHDYSDDPFLTIAAALHEIIPKENSEDFVRSAIEVGKRVSKPFLTITMNTLLPGLGEAAKTISENVDEYIGEKIKGHEKERADFQKFKSRLREATKGDKQTVFFIDELDRCRPDFAISLVERIKHLFDIENLVFVLLVNRQQLEHYAKGVYGSGVDGHGYLSKFINLTFKLPRRKEGESDSQSFAKHVLRRYGIENPDSKLEEFTDSIVLLADLDQMTYRDMEKAFSYYFAVGDHQMYQEIYAYIIFLKCKKPDIFFYLKEKNSDVRDAVKAHIDFLFQNLSRTRTSQWEIDLVGSMIASMAAYMDQPNWYPQFKEIERFSRRGYGNKAVAYVISKLNIEIV